jgi:hypothetical protein
MPGEGGKNFGLSARSALNDRYFAENKSTTRSKSLDNLLPSSGEPENFFGLSESRLNQRYLSQVIFMFKCHIYVKIYFNLKGQSHEIFDPGFFR